MRGEPILGITTSEVIGITPAYAGRTLIRKAIEFGPKDHPRVCGENFAIAATDIGMRGSPPRMRGEPCQGPRRQKVERITPAYAGRTPPVST